MRRARAYRALLLLYPPRFRREFGAPMVQAYGDQRRDRGARAWWTIARDLCLTLPSQHTEAFMNLRPQSKLVAGAMVTTAAIIVTAIIGGAFAALLLMLALAWILMSLLKERGAIASPGLWWKLAASGAGLFAFLFTVFAPPWPQAWREAVPGEVAWSVGFFGFVLAIVLIVTGILTGLVQRGNRRHAAG